MVYLVSGIKKDGKPYYAVKVVQEYKSGKHYTQMVFINKDTYDTILDKGLHFEYPNNPNKEEK